ncbi:MAG: PQQ-binding-like beta-propeller repeat protein [Luteitalea sp.]|nr:PQQ-binding-like beta-propeller repeat protein [Luteitalea sp.]
MARATRQIWLLAALTWLVLAAPLSAEHWPQWRGPAGTGASTEVRLPETWGEGRNIAWRTRLGGVGVSSPVVWGDRVFATSQSGRGDSRRGPRLGQGGEASSAERSLEGAAGGERGVRFLIEALNRVDGQRAWTYSLAAEGNLPSVHDKHNLASASPATDGERVYAVFGSGQVVAVDMNGKQVWARNLAREHGSFDINWGHGSSPIIHGNSLIVVAYHESASYLLAVDKRTGKQLWKRDRPSGILSYSTPIVVPGPGGDELIVNASTGVEAYAAATVSRCGTSTSRINSRFRSRCITTE